MQFDISKHLLDIVYSQTICWFALFFAPLISAVTMLKMFLIFYLRLFFVKKVSIKAFVFYHNIKILLLPNNWSPHFKAKTLYLMPSSVVLQQKYLTLHLVQCQYSKGYCFWRLQSQAFWLCVTLAQAHLKVAAHLENSRYQIFLLTLNHKFS